MSEQEISINLKMVTVPEEPSLGHYGSAAARRDMAAFNLGRFLKQLSILALIGFMSVACYLYISNRLVQSIEVVGNSMVPTLQPGNHYLLNRLAYHNAGPLRGDIVVLRDPGDHGFAVKRIIAMGGESVHFMKGKVYVNGEALVEPYLKPGTFTFTYSQAKEQFITCGKDQYFVLGDNRLQSIDSRAYGAVSRDDILGRVVLGK